MDRKPDKSPTDTKTRLVEAAGPVFARLGFRAATVQEICERAGANIAAVNYHFGDKLGLYREVLRSSRASSQHLTAASDLPAEQRLRVFIQALLTHLYGDGRPAWFAQVIAHEMAEPTSALAELIETETRPGFEALKKIISELHYLPVRGDRVMLCANSVMGQCLHYFHSRAVVAKLWPELRMTAEQIDQLAEHITTFSLAGMAGVSRRVRPRVARRTGSRKRERRWKR